MAILGLAGCAGGDDRDRESEGEHAYKPGDHAASPAIEEALVAACFARDAFESRPVAARAGGALEGLISLAKGDPADRNLIFAPSFQTDPTHDYDIIIPLSLDDVLGTLRSAIKVDYRHRGASNIDGYALRYLAKDRLLDGCGTETRVCTYDVYYCSEFDARMQFDGPLQAFRLVSLGRGRMDRAFVFHSIEDAGSREAQSRRIMESREASPSQAGPRPPSLREAE